MTLSQILSWAVEYLKNQQIENPRLEAEILIAHILKIKRIDFFKYPERAIKLSEKKKIKYFLQRRIRHEPTAYLIGYQPFLGLNFFVNRSVLIPRPETELLVENVIKTIKEEMKNKKKLAIVDLGTGSGAIAISLAKFFPHAKIIATDCSTKALRTARKNARYHNVQNRCLFLKSDLFPFLKEKVDLIISNPPYIAEKEIAKLQPEVKYWEPKSALVGGKDGLKFIKKIIKHSPKYLKPGGRLFLEFGYGQAKVIGKLIKEVKQYQKIEIIKDLAGIPRILKAKKK